VAKNPTSGGRTTQAAAAARVQAFDDLVEIRIVCCSHNVNTALSRTEQCFIDSERSLSKALAFCEPQTSVPLRSTRVILPRATPYLTLCSAFKAELGRSPSSARSACT